MRNTVYYLFIPCYIRWQWDRTQGWGCIRRVPSVRSKGVAVVSDSQKHDPWHPNIKGHTIIAEYLYEKLTQGILAQETPQQPM